KHAHETDAAGDSELAGGDRQPWLRSERNLTPSVAIFDSGKLSYRWYAHEPTGASASSPGAMICPPHEAPHLAFSIPFGPLVCPSGATQPGDVARDGREFA